VTVDEFSLGLSNAMNADIYTSFLQAKRLGDKRLAVLVDPDKAERDALLRLTDLVETVGVDFIFIGGSTLLRDNFSECVSTIKANCSVPTVLFPGSNKQVDPNADALLLLTLISGRNAEWLINQHVEAAFHIKQSGLEIIPTGYMLIDGGRETSVTYVSQTRPIPATQTEIAAATALAGQQLGLKLIYMDAGSGALKPVSQKMIRAVKSEIDLPLIVGGGIDSAVKATKACDAGSDVIVVGNALEKDPMLLRELVTAVRERSEANKV
jgi:phosphoglycerol geranylgeranyltransferase